MKNDILFTKVVMVFVLFTSCNTRPKSIQYGADGCHYCKMTIVDKIHGAQLVTNKGKVFKFDATECMLAYTRDNPAVEVGNFYTNYFESPTKLISVSDAAFLISEAIPSPMGANLTAFKTKESLEKVQAEKGGKTYTWDALKTQLDLLAL